MPATQPRPIHRIVSATAVRIIVRLLVSLIVSAACSIVIWHVIPVQLSIQSSIVGLPTIENYNIERLIDGYYLLCIGLPLLAVLIFHILSLVGPLKRSAQPPPPSLSAVLSEDQEAEGHHKHQRQDPTHPSWGQYGKCALVAICLAIEGEIGAHRAAHDPFIVAFLVGLGYLVILGLMYMICNHFASDHNTPQTIAAQPKVSTNKPLSLSLFNAYGALLVIPMLFWISEQTGVTVSAHHEFHVYPWIPFLLVAGLMVFAILLLLIYQKHWLAQDRISHLDRMSLTWIVAPAMVFVTTAALPGATAVNSFENGQPIASAWLILTHGAVPWKDVLFIHGLLGDPISGMIGFHIFGDTLWGYLAGMTMILLPLCWVTLFLFAAFVYRSHPLFLIFIGVLIALVVFLFPDFGNLPTNLIYGPLTPMVRFLFYPLQLICFGKALTHRFPTWTIVFIFVSVIQCVISPETAFVAISCGGTLVAFEWYSRKAHQSLLRAFSRSLWMIASGAGATLLLALLLFTTHTIGGFVGSYITFSSGHELIGGGTQFCLCLQSQSFLQIFIEIAPVGMMLLTLFYVGFKVRTGKPLTLIDWLSIAIAGIVALFEPIVLSQYDSPHIGEVFWISLPLLILWMNRSTYFFDWLIGLLLTEKRHFTSGRFTTALLLLAACLIGVQTVGSPEVLLTALASRYTPVVAADPQLSRLGYTNKGAIYLHMVHDLSVIFNEYAGMNGDVYDFTNAPLLDTFLLNRNPGSRFFFAAETVGYAAQESVITDLEHSKPSLVIFSSPGQLSQSDGYSSVNGVADSVFDYAVSRYILTHYHPFIDVDGELLFLLDTVHVAKHVNVHGLQGQIFTAGNLYSHVSGCVWGFAPNFLDQAPPSNSKHVPLHVSYLKRNSDGVEVFSVTIPTGINLADYPWLSLSEPRGLLTTAYSLKESSGTSANTLMQFSSLPQTGNPLNVEAGSCAQWYGYAGSQLILTANHIVATPQIVLES